MPLGRFRKEMGGAAALRTFRVTVDNLVLTCRAGLQAVYERPAVQSSFRSGALPPPLPCNGGALPAER